MATPASRRVVEGYTVEQRRRAGRLGARTRWSKVYGRRVRRLLAIESQAFDAYRHIESLLTGRDDELAQQLTRQTRRLFSSFADLYRFDGHELPEHERAFIAGVIDKLKGEVTTTHER